MYKIHEVSLPPSFLPSLLDSLSRAFLSRHRTYMQPLASATKPHNPNSIPLSLTFIMAPQRRLKHSSKAHGGTPPAQYVTATSTRLPSGTFISAADVFKQHLKRDDISLLAMKNQKAKTYATSRIALDPRGGSVDRDKDEEDSGMHPRAKEFNGISYHSFVTWKLCG